MRIEVFDYVSDVNFLPCYANRVEDLPELLTRRSDKWRAFEDLLFAWLLADNSEFCIRRPSRTDVGSSHGGYLRLIFKQSLVLTFNKLSSQSVYIRSFIRSSSKSRKH